jgi:hypothetical protein
MVFKIRNAFAKQQIIRGASAAQAKADLKTYSPVTDEVDRIRSNKTLNSPTFLLENVSRPKPAGLLPFTNGH